MQSDLGFNSDIFGAVYVICREIWDLTQIYLELPT
jgi:hypothetical protein